MPKGLPTPLCVTISIPTLSGERLFKTVGRCLDALERTKALDAIPIHWSFPACMLESNSTFANRTIPLLRGRLAAGRDMLLPRGYSAASHTLLLPEDVLTDNKWSVANPWHTGIGDVYPSARLALYPVNPDTMRESVRKIYDTEKYPLLLEGSDYADELSVILAHAGHKIQFDEININNPDTEIKRFLRPRMTGPRNPAILVLPILESVIFENIDQIFRDISLLPAKKYAFLNLLEVSELRVNGSTDWSVGTNHSAFSETTAPAGASMRWNAGYTRTDIGNSARNLRSGRSDPISAESNTRARLLSHSAIRSEDNQIGTGGPVFFAAEVKMRSLIADMSGIVALEDRVLSAQFDDGRLCNILHNGSPVLCGNHSNAYYIVENNRHESIREGSFSFDGDGVHGLRTAQAFRGPAIIRAGNIVSDFFFLDGYSCLFVSIVCVYPVFERQAVVDEWACLELPLFTIPRGVTAEVTARSVNGERNATSISRAVEQKVISGNGFCIISGGKSFTCIFPESGSNPVQPLPLRVRKSGRSYVLCINPGGSYRASPAAEISEYAHRMVLALDVNPHGDETLPSIRSTIFDEAGNPGCGKYKLPKLSS